MFRTRARDGPGLPYSSHPLYKLRRATLITAVVGFILDCFAIFSLMYNDDGKIPIFVFSIALLFISFVFVLYDLVNYAARRAAIGSTQGQGSDPVPYPVPGRPGEEPKWPSKRLVIFDLILAILFQWLFWGSFFAIINSYHRYYDNGSETLQAYGNLANFVASIEHAIAFWKELIARKKAAWRQDLEARPCQSCGHVDQEAIQEFSAPPAAAPTDAEAGPSRPSLFGGFGKGKITLPPWATGPNAGQNKDTRERDIEEERADATVHEPLLVTPDESTTEIPSGSGGYGTLEQSVESVSSVPETVVKKKDKGKKRLVEVE